MSSTCMKKTGINSDSHWKNPGRKTTSGKTLLEIENYVVKNIGAMKPEVQGNHWSIETDGDIYAWKACLNEWSLLPKQKQKTNRRWAGFTMLKSLIII